MRRRLAILTVVGMVAGILLGTVPARAALTFTVNQTTDVGDPNTGDGLCDVNLLQKGNQCTLRAAIQQANASAGADTIRFTIGTGAQTIAPLSALPTITEAVTIDGTTQPGFVGTPLITLSGASAGAGVTGLTLGVGGTLVHGLMIDAFGGDGISITAGIASTISGNWIGINALGGDAGNAGDGIRVGGSGSNIIGGTTAGTRNVISGNNANGVEILVDSSSNTVLGNSIGTNAGGTVAVGNSHSGVFVHRGPATIGGAGAAGNLISGNGIDGVLLAGTLAASVSVQGNAIGTNAFGTGALPNGGAGVQIVDASSNLVGVAGGTTGGSCQGFGCNIIAGNSGAGVSVTETVPNAAILNVIEGNYIGVGASGSAALPNSPGVSVGANNTVVGGSGFGDGNVIDSGPFADGVVVTSVNNQILGNRIGTDSLGVAALGNANGVHLVAGPNTVGGTIGTTPGGSCTGACNVISGNSTGVQIDATASDVLVQGNLIGIDSGGSTSVPNGTGVEVNGSSNTIGGTAVGEGNVISGNGVNGVTIRQTQATDPLPTGNLVQGNRIGTTPDGTAPLGNDLQGVALFDATGNTIGGTAGTTPGGACTGACNVISASGARGIEISNLDTAANVIEGDFVGLDATGTVIAGFANGDNSGGPGIRVESSATGTVIGGKSASARNVISGNSGEGIDIEGAVKTKVLGNYVGTDTTGKVDLGNGEVGAIHEPGVTVFGGSGNTIGGKGGARNLISGNGEAGVVIDGGAKSTKVQGNLIGTKANGTAALGNTGEGIDVVDGTKSTIGGTSAGLGNTIWFNGAAGIAVDAGTKNAIRGNSISGNGGLGIDLDPPGVNPNDAKDPDGGANLGQNYPVITSAVSGGGSIVIQGTFNSTPSTSGFTLELFSSPSCDASGFGEGKVLLGLLAAVATNANGNATWSVTLPAAVGPGSAITATATSSTGNTSELSACRTST